MSGILDDFKDAFAKRNNGLVQLIWLNVAVYVLTLLLFVTFTVVFKGGELYYKMLSYVNLSPDLSILVFRPWTIFTNVFIHSINPIMHIFPNMLILYWFGSILQEYLGSQRLISVYIWGALISALLAIAVYNLVPFYINRIPETTIIGSSGSVMAVAFATATLVPDHTVYLFLIGPVRIKYIAFFMFILSLAGSIGANAAGGVIHIGGALSGYLCINQLKAGRDWSVPIEAIVNFWNNLFKKRSQAKIRVAYRQKEASYSSSTTGHSGFPDEEEVDEILDKISRSGYESLTKEEKQKLFKASQK